MTAERLLYALFMGLALLTALLLRPRSALPPVERYGLLAGALLGGVAGAKLPFVLLGGGLLSAAGWLADGKSILSAFAGGYLGVELAKRLLGVREKTGDGFAVPLAAGAAVGRWGCFLNGCCSAPGHPVPLYESAFHAAMAVLLWRLRGVEALRWQLLKLYLIAYAAFRFAMEFIRVEPRLALGITGYQYGAVGLATAMGLLWWRDERLKRSRAGPPQAACCARDPRLEAAAPQKL